VEDLISDPVPSLARSTAAMSAGTMLSRVTGFVRQWAMAVALGVTISAGGRIPIASAFNIANNIPNMIYELVAGGVLSSMFIPIFLERRRTDGEAGAFSFANTMFSVSFVVFGVVALLGTLLPQVFVWTQTFTVSLVDSQLAVYLFRFFAVQIIFYGFVALSTGVLHSYRTFFATAIAPLFNNVVVIIALLGFYVPLRDARPDLALVALGVGTTLGVVALFAAQVPALLKVGFRFRWRLDFSDPSLGKMLRKGAWVLGYVAVNIVGISFRNAFATGAMRDGSAVLSYAWMWYQLPYGVLAVSYISAVFPELSRAADTRDWSAYKGYLSRGLRAMALLMLPAVAILFALGTQLVTLFRFGKFPAEAVPLVTAVLAGWTIGLFFFASYMLLLRAFYAMQDTRTPFYTNIALTVVQVGLYAGLTRLIPGEYALVGIPLADSVFFILHTGVLLVILRRRIGGFSMSHVFGGWARSLGGAAAGGLAAWAAVLATPALGGSAAGNIARVILGGALGLGVSYGALRLLRIDEMAYVDGLLARAGTFLTPRRARP
jgi:putative peptidoglycan lipid II flippase